MPRSLEFKVIIRNTSSLFVDHNLSPYNYKRWLGIGARHGDFGTSCPVSFEDLSGIFQGVSVHPHGIKGVLHKEPLSVKVQKSTVIEKGTLSALSRCS